MYFRLLTALAGLLMCASYAAAFPNAYITNLGDNTVSVIDTRTDTYVTKIPLGDGQEPYGVSVSSDGKRVYVSNQAGNSISVIDALTDVANPTIINTINLGSMSPRGLAINPAGTRLYVTNFGASSVSVIDVSALPPNTTVTPTVVASPTVGNNPTGIAINATGTYAYVTNFGSGTVSVIDIANNNTILGSPIPVGSGSNPTGIAIGTTGAAAGKIYVANYGANSVSVIDASTRTVTNTITNVGSNPYAITVAPDGSSVYVTNAVGDSVVAINTTTNAITPFTMPTGSMPQGIAVAPDGLNVYAATYRGDDNMGSVARILVSEGTVSYLKNQPDSNNPDFVNFFNAPHSLGNFIGPQLYTITTTAGSNGTVTSPEGEVATNGNTIDQIVRLAATAVYTITPNTYYRVNSIAINGTPIDLNTDTRYDKVAKTLTLSSISDDIELDITFIKDFDYVSVARSAVSGQADGVVTSSVGTNGSINCSASTSPVLCNTLFQEGTTVTLTATPNTGYYFAGWVGQKVFNNGAWVHIYNGDVCDGKTDSVCSFTMRTYTQVTATFTDQAPNDLVRMVPEGTYKHTIQEAFNAAISTTTEIQLALADFPEPALNLNNTVANFTLSGGWNADKTFQTQGATHSTITGSLTISAGQLTINGVTIK